MIQVAQETILTLGEAAEKLKVSKATVTKWVKVGTKGVRLEAIKFGSHWRTSEEALQRFGERQTIEAIAVPFNFSVKKPTSKHAERAHQRAVRELRLLYGKHCKRCKVEIVTGKVMIPKGTKLYCPDCIIKLKSAKLGDRIRAFRWARQLSLPAVYEKTGISVDFLRDYEFNIKLPKPEHLQTLVEFFGGNLTVGLECSVNRNQ